MYAAQYRRKRILEELYKNQAETINLLHKTKHGKPVDESYKNIKAAEIREIIRDMGWDKESKPKEKKRKEAKTVSKGSHKGQKKKITHETSPATSDSESKGTERASTSQKSQRRKEHMKLAMTQVTVNVKALSGSVPYLFIFVIRENEILMAVIRDSLFFLFLNRARDPPCTTLKKYPTLKFPTQTNTRRLIYIQCIAFCINIFLELMRCLKYLSNNFSLAGV